MNPTFSLLQLYTLQYAFDGCAINMITDDNRSQYRKGEINIIHEVSIETIFIKRGRKLKQNKQTRQIFVKMKRGCCFVNVLPLSKLLELFLER